MVRTPLITIITTLSLLSFSGCFLTEDNDLEARRRAYLLSVQRSYSKKNISTVDRDPAVIQLLYEEENELTPEKEERPLLGDVWMAPSSRKTTQKQRLSKEGDLGNRENFSPPKTRLLSKPSKYKSGRYLTKGVYETDHGMEIIVVDMEIIHDIVVGIRVDPRAKNRESKKFQQQLSRGVAEKVMGRNIESIRNLSAINGASLASKGFERAVHNIRNSAKK